MSLRREGVADECLCGRMLLRKDVVVDECLCGRISLWRGQGATPAAFYLGLCRLRGILSPPAPQDYAARGLFFAAATSAAGGPFSFAAAKNGIGRGPRCHYDCSRRNHPSSQQRRLESSAEPRYFKACCRRNHSPSRQRKLESDADLVAVTTTAGGTFFRCIDSQVLA